MFILIQISENLGMAMVFTIVSALQEKIAVIIEDRKRQEEEEKERVFREKEEAEQVICISEIIDCWC